MQKNRVKALYQDWTSLKQVSGFAAFSRNVSQSSAKVRKIVYAYRNCPKNKSPLSVWPHLFRGASHEKRRGEQLKWSLVFRLYIGSFLCAQLPGPVHTARMGRVCFCVFSLGLYFVYLFVSLICLCIPILLCFPWQLSHLPYSFWR